MEFWFYTCLLVHNGYTYLYKEDMYSRTNYIDRRLMERQGQSVVFRKTSERKRSSEVEIVVQESKISKIKKIYY